KIDGTESKREDYYTVKEIISPELLKLSNGLIIRLLGIKEYPSKNGKASEFLIGKTQGQQIFLKYDQQKYDSNNNLMAYVYLKNKTFINAHLLKYGFVKLDHKIIHRYTNKFKELSQHMVNQ
ncbi:MAG: thermonuclease family protein, partial [bacterium]|nr:thermonuclease family protein [bacterium]